MTENGPLILLTNDDGIHAEGLRNLKTAMDRLGRVSIVAPEFEQSAAGHSITLQDPVRVREVTRNGAFYGHAVRGTPADAVKLALYSLLPRLPDLVVSGINDGANVGINVLYSGTVSAATEAAVLGVPAMAVSLDQKKDPPFTWALPLIESLARRILSHGLPPGIALNVNLPALPLDEVRGVKLTRQGLFKYEESYEQREDPRGNVYYWLSGEILPDEADEASDLSALKMGYVSVTPLLYDLTAHSGTEELADLVESL
ncbi:MAG: 5'/3'-nucleotidase SurE [Deltaproteobacteria bacterium]